jgi:hypothetical protein
MLRFAYCLLISFCRVNHFLEAHFSTIVPLGIGHRQQREGATGSFVVDVTLVSKLPKETGFNRIALNSDYVPFFETFVLVLPEPTWTLCSLIQNQNDCIQFMNPNEIKIRCGWCSLLMSCMQGMCSCDIGIEYDLTLRCNRKQKWSCAITGMPRTILAIIT